MQFGVETALVVCSRGQRRILIFYISEEVSGDFAVLSPDLACPCYGSGASRPT